MDKQQLLQIIQLIKETTKAIMSKEETDSVEEPITSE